jgi:hypothetical protein
MKGWPYFVAFLAVLAWSAFGEVAWWGHVVAGVCAVMFFVRSIWPSQGGRW